MKARIPALALAALIAAPCFADNKTTAGTVISMQAVECGTKKEGKKKTTSLTCHQYVVRTATTEYQIRQRKPEEETVIPANTPIQFTLDKNKMKFKANGKKYEYLIVGTSALESK